MVNLFIVYELDRWLQNLNGDFPLTDSYTGYGIGFGSCSLFSYPGFDCYFWGGK